MAEAGSPEIDAREAALTEADGREADGREVDVLVIGAGMSGLAMLARLKAAGVTNIVAVEKAAGLGGVWRDNVYPGAGCDVPSHLYSYGFAPKPDWSRKYASQPEILEYFQDVARRLDLERHVRLNAQARRAAFDAAAGRWRVELSDGTRWSARALVAAAGQLNTPAWPDIAGLESFAGPLFHSARWDRSASLSGRRVAIIGSAASAIQILPHAAQDAAHLTVFQRTPNWVIPKPDRAFSRVEKALFARLPGFRALYRGLSFLLHESRFAAFRRNSLWSRIVEGRMRRRIARAVPDPDLRARLTPDYPPGCKRILISNDYFTTLQRPDVTLETRGIARVEPDAIVLADGERAEVDLIVLATGFRAGAFLEGIEIINAEGESLARRWAETPAAYRGVAAPGFANLFVLYGPNTNLGHNSIIFMVERQVEYVRDKIVRLLSEDLSRLEVRAEALDRYDARLQRDLERTVWAADCASWYKRADGRIANNWSGLASAYAALLRRRDDAAWIAQPRAASR